MFKLIGRFVLWCARFALSILSYTIGVVWRAHVDFFREFGRGDPNDPLHVGRTTKRKPDA